MRKRLKKAQDRRLATRHSLGASSEGQAQVEFVLSIIFVVVLIFGIVELIMLLYTYNVLADSAKEGVRQAIVLGSDSSNGTTSNGSHTCSTTFTAAQSVYSTVCSYAATSFHDVTGMSVSVSYPDTSNAAGNRVQVTVSYPYKSLLGLAWETTTININAAAEGRIAF